MSAAADLGIGRRGCFRWDPASNDTRDLTRGDPWKEEDLRRMVGLLNGRLPELDLDAVPDPRAREGRWSLGVGHFQAAWHALVRTYEPLFDVVSYDAGGFSRANADAVITVVVERDDRMYVSSLDPSRLTTAQRLLLVRSDWGVEDNNHHTPSNSSSLATAGDHDRSPAIAPRLGDHDANHPGGPSRRWDVGPKTDRKDGGSDV